MACLCIVRVFFVWIICECCLFVHELLRRCGEGCVELCAACMAAQMRYFAFGPTGSGPTEVEFQAIGRRGEGRLESRVGQAVCQHYRETYIQPRGEFSRSQRAVVEQTEDFMARFLGCLSNCCLVSHWSSARNAKPRSVGSVVVSYELCIKRWLNLDAGTNFTMTLSFGLEARLL